MRLYRAEAPRTIVAREAALIISSVYQDKAKAVWFFLGMLGLKGQAEFAICFFFMLMLLAAFLWGTQ